VVAQSNEVLVIDNLLDFAEECVDFIRTQCGVGATYALDDVSAKEALRLNPIKVILLDYDMPVTGLALFPELKKIDPNVQIIFVSAVATTQVLFDADKLPFAAKMPKATCYEQLPQLIPSLMLEYAKQANSLRQQPFFTETRKALFVRQKIEYTALSYHIISKEHVGSWQTTEMIRVGETLKRNNEIDFERTFALANSFQIASDLSADIEEKKIFGVKVNLSTQLERKVESGYSEKIKGAISLMQELTLSGDNSDPLIKSRFYDFAQIYMEMKLVVQKVCSCCSNVSISPITVYFPLPRIQYRIREYYDGKEMKTIDTGICEGNLLARKQL